MTDKEIIEIIFDAIQQSADELYQKKLYEQPFDAAEIIATELISQVVFNARIKVKKKLANPSPNLSR